MKPEQRAQIIMTTKEKRYLVDVYLHWPKSYYAGQYVASNRIYIGKGSTLEQAVANLHFEMFPSEKSWSLSVRR